MVEKQEEIRESVREWSQYAERKGPSDGIMEGRGPQCWKLTRMIPLIAETDDGR